MGFGVLYLVFSETCALSYAWICPLPGCWLWWEVLFCSRRGKWGRFPDEDWWWGMALIFIGTSHISFFFKKKTALLRWLTYNKRHVFKVYYLVHFVVCLYLWNCRDKIMSVSVTPTSFFVPLWNPFLHSPPFSLPSLSLLDNHWCASRHYRWVCTF